MTTTFLDCNGFAELNMIAASNTVGSPIISTTRQASGLGCLELVPTSTPVEYWMQKQDGNDQPSDPWLTVSADGIGVGFRVMFTETSAAQAAGIMFFEMSDTSTGNLVYGLRLAANGDFQMQEGNQDSTGLTKGTTTAPFVANRWYHIEFFAVLGASAVSKVWLDGVLQTNMNVTDAHNIDTGGAGNFGFTQFRGGDATASNPTVFIDDVYFYLDDTGTDANSTFGELVTITAFQASGSASTDYGTGHTPDSGSWDNVNDAPIIETANDWVVIGVTATNGAGEHFDAANSVGHGPGPKNDNIIGTVLGAKWVYRISRGNGGGTLHGSSFGEAETPTIKKSTNIDGAISASAKTFIWNADVSQTEVPTSGEFMLGGVFNDGGAQETELFGMMGMVAHKIAALSVTDLSDGLMPKYPSSGLTVEFDDA